jgi:hypothetical protein
VTVLAIMFLFVGGAIFGASVTAIVFVARGYERAPEPDYGYSEAAEYARIRQAQERMDDTWLI